MSIDRIAAGLNATRIGRGLARVFTPVASLLKYAIIFAALCGGFMWLVSPEFRFNVRTVEGPGPKPTDCDFMTAPLGNKGCHYEMQRVLADSNGNYIASVNWFNSRIDGQRDDPNMKPAKLIVSWEKVQE